MNSYNSWEDHCFEEWEDRHANGIGDYEPTEDEKRQDFESRIDEIEWLLSLQRKTWYGRTVGMITGDSAHVLICRRDDLKQMLEDMNDTYRNNG